MSGRRPLLALLATAGAVLLSATVTATARAANAYVTDPGGGKVGQFVIDPKQQLVPLSPAAINVSGYVLGIAAAPDGRHVYVVHGEIQDRRVTTFDVARDGSLKQSSEVDAGPRAADIAITPDGNSAYVLNQGSDSVGMFSIANNGSLTAMRPAEIKAGNSPQGLAVTPNGESLYVTSGAGRDIYQYSILRSGRLLNQRPRTAYAGGGPRGIAVSPDSRFAYVTLLADNAVLRYRIGDGGELLDPVDFPTANRPRAVAVGANGGNVYVANADGPGTSQYAASPLGLLTPLTPATVFAPNHANDIAVASDGNSLFVVSDVQLVYQYTFGSSGELIGNDVARFGGRPSDIAVSPGSPSASERALSLGALDRNAKAGTGRLAVRVGKAGRVTLTGRRVRRVSRRVEAGSRIELPVRPRRGARQRLRRAGHIGVRVRVELDPVNGGRVSRARSLRLLRRAST